MKKSQFFDHESEYYLPEDESPDTIERAKQRAIHKPKLDTSNDVLILKKAQISDQVTTTNNELRHDTRVESQNSYRKFIPQTET